MLSEWINPKYLDEKEIIRIRSDFLNSKPYKNFSLDNFFIRGRIMQVKNAVKKEKFELVGKDLFTLSHTADLSSSKNAVLREFYKLFSSKEFVAFVGKLTQEKLSLRIDMQSHSMKQGNYLLFHDDVVEGRKIAYVVYLSGLSSNDGGALRLYDHKKPSKPIRQICPEFNSFMCFKVSDKSVHDVGEIKSNKERLTIGGWFYGN